VGKLFGEANGLTSLAHDCAIGRTHVDAVQNIDGF
jgi:hypothetical protein